MTISELFRQYSWEEVRVALRNSKYFFGSKNWDVASNRMVGWERAFRFVCGVESHSDHGDLKVIYGPNQDGYKAVYAVQSGIERFLHFCTLTEWASMPIDNDVFFVMSPIEFIVECLLEMTINGYSDDEITAFVNKLTSQSNEVGIPHEEVMERLRKKLGVSNEVD